jgi:hypothetical protein
MDFIPARFEPLSEGLIMANSNLSRLKQKTDQGKVRWHTDFATAQQAARQSHKPILLFQLMGRLGDKFC